MGLFGFGKSDEEKASYLHHKGVNLSKKEKFEEALECYNEAISIEPEVWDFWFSKGSALSELERFEEALECYNEATVLDSWKTRWEAWFCKGQVLSHLGRYEETFECFDEAIGIESKNPDDGGFKRNRVCKPSQKKIGADI